MASTISAQYLDVVIDQAWSRSHFRIGEKYNYVTKNIPKFFNAWINKVRGFFIIEMVDMIRHKMMERMDHIRAFRKKWRGKLVPNVFKYVQTLVKGIGQYIGRRSNDHRAEVVGPKITCVVRLDERTCSCRVWQVSSLPCVHAATFITRVRGLDICDFVLQFYSLEMFKKSYAHTINPVPSIDDWVKIDVPFTVGPPGTRKNRIKNPDEKKA
ncbi:hypothetical protein QJS10_CPB12g00598 [Acorus calamus]|uniref:SWIM-type domain-containing protein n=1 Tax=Acorus calamus TaxID=4465 RepID=A0AAV9DMB7_ACOCL|nr:hypothetical protein QJS10_CPB12g00598 [Acorus calamus]